MIYFHGGNRLQRLWTGHVNLIPIWVEYSHKMLSLALSILWGPGKPRHAFQSGKRCRIQSGVSPELGPSGLLRCRFPGPAAALLELFGWTSWGAAALAPSRNSRLRGIHLLPFRVVLPPPRPSGGLCPHSRPAGAGPRGPAAVHGCLYSPKLSLDDPIHSGAPYATMVSISVYSPELTPLFQLPVGHPSLATYSVQGCVLHARVTECNNTHKGPRSPQGPCQAAGESEGGGVSRTHLDLPLLVLTRGEGPRAGPRGQPNLRKLEVDFPREPQEGRKPLAH